MRKKIGIVVGIFILLLVVGVYFVLFYGYVFVDVYFVFIGE